MMVVVGVENFRTNRGSLKAVGIFQIVFMYSCGRAKTIENANVWTEIL